MCTYTYIHTMHTQTHMHTDTHIQIHTYTHTYTQTHTYIHTHTCLHYRHVSYGIQLRNPSMRRGLMGPCIELEAPPQMPPPDWGPLRTQTPVTLPQLGPQPFPCLCAQVLCLPMAKPYLPSKLLGGCGSVSSRTQPRPRHLVGTQRARSIPTALAP